jgi:hypothetical protein
VPSGPSSASSTALAAARRSGPQWATVNADTSSTPKSGAAIGPAQVTTPPCANAASWKAVKSLCPNQHFPAAAIAAKSIRSRSRDQPYPPRAAMAMSTTGSFAIRISAASRSSSPPAKRWCRARQLGSTTTAWPAPPNHAAARSIACGSPTKPAGA